MFVHLSEENSSLLLTHNVTLTIKPFGTNAYNTEQQEQLLPPNFTKMEGPTVTLTFSLPPGKSLDLGLSISKGSIQTSSLAGTPPLPENTSKKTDNSPNLDNCLQFLSGNWTHGTSLPKNSGYANASKRKFPLDTPNVSGTYLSKTTHSPSLMVQSPTKTTTHEWMDDSSYLTMTSDPTDRLC